MKPRPGGVINPFLRAGHGDVDAPGIHLERNATERGDGVDHEQRVVAGGADRFADRLDVVDDARGGVDLRHQNGLDLALGVGLQPRFHRFRPHRAGEVARQHLDLGAQHLGRLAPTDGEAPAFEHQHLVAAREHVGQRRLPGAVAVGGVDVGVALGAEDLLEVGEQAVRKRDHRAGIDVDGRPVHGGEHGIGNDGGTRDGEEFTACGKRHFQGLYGRMTGGG